MASSSLFALREIYITSGSRRCFKSLNIRVIILNSITLTFIFSKCKTTYNKKSCIIFTSCIMHTSRICNILWLGRKPVLITIVPHAANNGQGLAYTATSSSGQLFAMTGKGIVVLHLVLFIYSFGIITQQM